MFGSSIVRTKTAPKYKDINEEIIKKVGQSEHENFYPKYVAKLENLRIKIRQVELK